MTPPARAGVGARELRADPGGVWYPNYLKLRESTDSDGSMWWYHTPLEWYPSGGAR